MTPEQRYMRKCTQKGVIIDTNLLALLLVGGVNPTLQQIQACSRISGYTLEDLRGVAYLAGQACKIVVTPQILAEVANITFEIRHYGGFDAFFNQVVSFLESTHEKHHDKSILAASSNLNILKMVGFSDTSIVTIAREHDLLVITDDGPLTGILSTLNIDSLNINYIRGASWLARG